MWGEEFVEGPQEVLDRIVSQLRAVSSIIGEVAEELKALEIPVTPPVETVLDVPYLSQWGPNANKRRGDCGPACVAMSAHFLTRYTPTVDEAGDACRQPATGEGSFFTTLYQLRDGLRQFGVAPRLATPYAAPKLTVEVVKSQIDLGKPSIALVDYKKLREETNPLDVVHNQDQGYNFGHFVLTVGYDELGVFVHDPDFWGTQVDKGARRWIPYQAFEAALQNAAIGNTYGSSGIIVP